MAGPGARLRQGGHRQPAPLGDLTDVEILCFLTRGGFRFSRNPMYLGFALLLCGAAGAAGGTTTWLCPLLFILIAQFVYIPFEERAMTRVFGAQYAAYRRQVRRWC